MIWTASRSLIRRGRGFCRPALRSAAGLLSSRQHQPEVADEPLMRPEDHRPQARVQDRPRTTTPLRHTGLSCRGASFCRPVTTHGACSRAGSATRARTGVPPHVRVPLHHLRPTRGAKARCLLRRLMTSLIATANSSESPTSTTDPQPWTSSSTSPTGVATTAQPRAIDSSRNIGDASLRRRQHRDGAARLPLVHLVAGKRGPRS